MPKDAAPAAKIFGTPLPRLAINNDQSLIYSKISPLFLNPWRSTFKNTPFLLKSMDHASNQKRPHFSMQMRTSICSTFGLDCRDRVECSLFNSPVGGFVRSPEGPSYLNLFYYYSSKRIYSNVQALIDTRPDLLFYSKEGSCGDAYKGKAKITTTGSDCSAMGGSAQYSGSSWGDCTLDVCLLDKHSDASYVAAKVD